MVPLPGSPKEAGWKVLLALGEKWRDKYSLIDRSCKDNRENLSIFFQFP